jgi:hypothetical protein
LEGKEIKKRFFPLDTVYALIATRDIFYLTRGKTIGLIGPKSKLDLIKELIKYNEYSQYLGIGSFDQYLFVPERGSCNDIEALFEDLICQAEGKRCDLYLVGMGISKLMILSRWRDHTQSLVIDIGCGMDALAGIVPRERFYFGEWVNFRLKSWNYKDIDILENNKTRFMPLIKWMI